MLKRLTEKFNRKKGRRGFTMTELLIVIAIIAVLCAIAIPSIIAISRSLKFKQRNEYAKAVFMAAQAHLTEMHSDGTLTALRNAEGASAVPEDGSKNAAFPAEDWSREYVYTSSNKASTVAFNLILPPGSVDETIRDKQIMIEYNPITGNVFSVFYSEEGQTLRYPSADGESGKGIVTRDEKARKKIMLGYCDGSGLSSQELEIEECRADVFFDNGQEGIVTVSVTLPEMYSKLYNTFAEGLQISLEIQREAIDGSVGSNQSITLPIKLAGNADNCSLSEDGTRVLVTYPIDSLINGGSFANLSADTDEALTKLADESTFRILPGENVTIIADAEFIGTDANSAIEIRSGMASGVNPMFEGLSKVSDKYMLTVSNGRNLQNLNALSPTVAKLIDTVSFTGDVNWNDTVSYYNNKYGTYSATARAKTYTNSTEEAPARQLPYFVPIHNADLFGEAYFAYPNEDGLLIRLEKILQWLFRDQDGQYIHFRTQDDVPTLTDELDGAVFDAKGNVTSIGVPDHAAIQGNKHKVSYLNIDSTKYCLGKDYYAGTVETDNDRFTGLFGYVNTAVSDLFVVNPTVKGFNFEGRGGRRNNPATGALIGCAGYDTLVTGCGVYIDTADAGFNRSKMTSAPYSKDAAQNWYGVSGEGAVGGLVGYAKSHRTVTGELNGDLAHLAFSRCFAAVNVSGNMRGAIETRYFGYSNGVGGFIGNSELTNFFDCYASGDVYGTNGYVSSSSYGNAANAWGLFYDGRFCTGTGGFVGTSHGTRYTNCFATGDVEGKSANGSTAGGFVGIMCYDETRAYGNIADTDKIEVAQHTVFSSCYAVGLAIGNKSSEENFSGANARIKLNLQNILAYSFSDYYRLYAPYVLQHTTGNAFSGYTYTEPPYQEDYIHKDSYYLSQYKEFYNTDNDNTNKCAVSARYEDLQRLHLHDGIQDPAYSKEFIDGKLNELKRVSISDIGMDEPLKLTDYLETVFGKNFFSRVSTTFWEFVRQAATTLDFQIRYNFYFAIFNNEQKETLEDVYARLYRQGFSSEHWGAATEGTTHSYSLTGNGWVYPFSKINGLDYYGDWPGMPLTAGLAYYEKYEDGTYGYFFTDDRISTLKNASVVSDGYALFTANSNDTIGVTTYNADGTTLASASTSAKGWYQESFAPYSQGGRPGPNSYSVHLLPSSLLKASDTGFYTRMVVTVNSSKTYTFYYNPNFALTQINPGYGSTTATQPKKAPDQIYIRTARQLKALSSVSSCWGKGYNYVQMLDIDPDTYTASSYKDPAAVYDKTASLNTIGNAETPFNGTYNGAGGYVEKAALTNLRTKNGLFGVIGETGSVSNLNVVYDTFEGDANAASSALIACESAGALNNIDLSFVEGKDGITVNAAENAALLVGLNKGTVSGCSVKAEKATFNSVNAGVLVGKSEGGSIDSFTVSIKEVNAKCTGAVGILVGSAEDTQIIGVNAALSANLKGSAARMGGIVGYINGGSVADIPVNLTGDNGGANVGEMGYAAGCAVGTSFRNVRATAMKDTTLTAKQAAGFVANASGTSFNNTETTIYGNADAVSIRGTQLAAGFACSVREGGYVSVSTVELNGAQIDGKQAAGFAAEIDCPVGNSDVRMTTGTRIIGTEQAAGYACTVSSAAEITNCDVNGSGSIRADGGTAAGYAVSNDGTVSNCIVSPARHDTNNLSNAYLSTDNDHLTVTGKDAAGFVANNSGNLTVCSALGTVTAQSGTAAGFAIRNEGTAERCMANTAVNGTGFIEENNGTALNCYAWYTHSSRVSGKADALSEGETGKYFGCYFARLDMEKERPAADDTKTATVFCAKGYPCTVNETEKAADGTFSVEMLITDLTVEMLNAEGDFSWVAGSSYGNANPFHSINPAAYVYPLIHAHYGDWVYQPMAHYGIAYYEKIDNGGKLTYNLALTDCADTFNTKDHLDYSFDNIDSGNNANVTEAGYVLFCKDPGQFASFNNKSYTGEYTERKDIADAANFSGLNGIDDATFKSTYCFYDLPSVGSQVSIFQGIDKKTAVVNPCFARAIYRASKFAPTYVYEIRVSEQLANIRTKTSGSFKQTRDFALNDKFVALTEFKGSYEGNSHEIEINCGGIFGNVSGTVSALTLNAEKALSIGTAQGVFAERITDGAALSNVTLNLKSVSTDSTSDAGLLAGSISGGTFKVVRVDADGTLSAPSAKNVGGFAGAVSGGSYTSVTLRGNVSGGTENAGGFAGRFDAYSLDGGVSVAAKNQLTSGAVNVGGFAGSSDQLTVSNIALKEQKITANGAKNVGGFIGAVTKTSLEACTVEKAEIKADGAWTAGGLIGTETTCTVDKCKVTETSVTVNTGTLTVKENNKDVEVPVQVGGILGVNTDTEIKDCTVEKLTLDVTAHMADVGGLTGNLQPSGSIVNNVNSVTKLGGSITVNAPIANIGGICGRNSIDLNGVSAAMDITYRREAGDQTAYIGGLVGIMDGGSLGSTDASIKTEVTAGKIRLLIPENEPEAKNPVTAKKHGTAPTADTKEVKDTSQGTKKLVVGGAVGMDGSGVLKYTNVKTAAELDASWAKQPAPSAANPAGLGSVGKFIGHINDGSFTNCTDTGAAGAKYQFLGTVTVKGSGSINGMYYSTKLSKNTKPTAVTTYEDRSAYGFYDTDNSAFYLYATNGDYNDGKYYNYPASIRLDNCTYLSSGKTYRQELQNQYYYKRGTETTHNQYQTKLINTTSELVTDKYYLITDADSKKAIAPSRSGSDLTGFNVTNTDFAESFLEDTDLEKARVQYKGQNYWLWASASTAVGKRDIYLSVEPTEVRARSAKNNVSFTMDNPQSGFFRMYAYEEQYVSGVITRYYKTRYCWLNPANKNYCGTAESSSHKGENTDIDYSKIEKLRIYQVDLSNYWSAPFTYQSSVTAQVITSVEVN